MIKTIEEVNNVLDSKRDRINKLNNTMNFHEAANDIEMAYATAKAIVTLEREYIVLLQKYIDSTKKAR